MTTSRSPAWHCSTAAWIMRLSPGQHSAVTAVPPVRVPSWIGRRPGPEVPGPADGLVHGGHAELGQLVHDGQVGPGDTGDDHVAHQLMFLRS